MSLNDLQKASLRSGIIGLGQVINPDTGAPLTTGDLGGSVAGIEDVPGLQAALDAKAEQADIDAAVSALVASAPGALNTLDELAAALGDDANYAATITTALAGKQPLDSDLTAIAALTTTAFGRSLLTMADAAAALAALDALQNPMTTVGDMVYAGAGGENRALGSSGATATASGVNGSYPTSNALDGNDATEFRSNSGGPEGKWFRVDLGAAYAIEKLRLRQNGNGAYSGRRFKIEYSTNDSTWVELVANTGIVDMTDFTYTLPSITTARYWRVTVLEATGQGFGYEWFIHTLGLLAPSGVPDRLATTTYGRSLLALADATALAVAAKGIRSGTSNPVGPSDGDLFYRSDLDLLIRYRSTGTRWVCVCEHNLELRPDTAIPLTSTGSARTSHPGAGRGLGIFVSRLYCSTYVAGTNDGSNYWTVTLDTEGSAISTVSNAANSVLQESDTVDAALSVASYPWITATIAKVSNPGGFYGVPVLEYRFIVT